MNEHIAHPVPAEKKVLSPISSVAGVAVLLVLGLLMLRVARAQFPSGPEASTSAEIAQRLNEQTRPRKAVPFNPKDFDKYVGYYELAPAVFLHIFRTDDRYFAQLPGQQPVENFPDSPNEFFATAVAAQISFVIDAKGQVTGLVLHQGGLLRPGQRVNEAVATKAAADLQQRISSNMPSQGTEAALRHQIDTLERGDPDYDVMAPELAVATRQQLPKLKELFAKMGDLKSLTFSKVLPSGADLYIATFAHGQLECMIAPLTADGKVTGDFFHLLP